MSGQDVTSPPRIVRGEPAGRGTEGVYYRLTHEASEPRVRRTELGPSTGAPPGERRSLLHFVQFTDIHTTDVQSPGRYEFMHRLHGGPATLGLVIPAFRPQEVLNAHAFEATIRTVNRIEGSPETGAPIDFVICTGDNIDNQQMNELGTFLTFMEGGTVTPASGGPQYEGVQSADWEDPGYWHPDETAGGPRDWYKSRWGFPQLPGLMEEAIRPFEAEGIRFPWLSCYGNHDALALGAARANPSYEQLVSGSRKPYALPPDLDPLEHLETFISNPEIFLSGPARSVTPDSNRRIFSRQEFVEAHLKAGGHGFTRENREAGTAYYVCDDFSLRLIVLDTTNPAGHYRGSVGAGQLAWLEERLAEVHSRYYAPDGTTVWTGARDRLVVLYSHHGLASLISPLIQPPPLNGGGHDLPRALGPEVESLLHRFPNVILWVNGDIHRHAIHPRPDPHHRSAGFWEVTTSSLVDWPCQARRIEVVDNRDGTLSILCTPIDHRAPPDPGSAEGLDRLASLHRELAANDPHAGICRGLAGEPCDRTVELLRPAPFGGR